MENESQHFRIIGMKWGVRRYQNPDGSLTPAGRKRYLNSKGRFTTTGKLKYAKDRLEDSKDILKRMKMNNDIKKKEMYEKGKELSGKGKTTWGISTKARLATYALMGANIVKNKMVTNISQTPYVYTEYGQRKLDAMNLGISAALLGTSAVVNFNANKQKKALKAYYHGSRGVSNESKSQMNKYDYDDILKRSK